LGLLARDLLPCLAPPEELLARLRTIRPAVIWGYAGVVHRLATHMSAIDRRSIRPQLVVAGAETLSDAMRREVRQAFRCMVLDTYGSTEFLQIAVECPESGYYHVIDDSVVVEVLREGRAAAVGEEGELVATGLHSYAMPLVRYRLGDRVVRGPSACPCGAPFSTLAGLKGRAVDWFPLPGGGREHGFFFGMTIAARPWVRRFQVIQKEIDLLQINLAPYEQPGEGELEDIRRKIEEKIGPRVRLEITLVDDIAPGKNGKSPKYLPLRSTRRNRVVVDDGILLESATTTPH
jgi:phenylacetate-CoA ligase